ncbi:MAG: MurR/RpiR family transcriptional regulator [Hyphomicrobiales bacterium]|nr:MurR/RpiR family transcriptional regulator [Hyphomicrobiales bacterium]
MATRLALRIQDRFDALTHSEKKLASLLLDRPDEILTVSATEMARVAGVSKATTARFFRSLGYADFNDVRLQAREERNRTGPVQQVPMPAEAPTGAATVPIHLQVEMANLTHTFEALRSDTVTSAVEQLAEAQRVWIVGLGGDNGLARHARLQLSRIRPGVEMVSENPRLWPEELASAGPSDALVLVALRPWPAAADAALAFARTTRLAAIVVTDPTGAGRARRHGGTPLVCHVSTPGPEASHTTVLSMLTLIATALAAKAGGQAERRRELIDTLREELDASD